MERRPSRRPLIFGLLVGLFACRPPGTEDTLLGWELVDLWRLAPEVTWLGGAPDRAGAPYFANLSYLGPGARPDLSIPIDKRPRRVRAARVRCLVQREGTELRWTLKLGATPYLSFLPLRNEDYPRRFRYLVSVEEGSERVAVLATSNGDDPSFAAPRVTVDLGPWSGRRVTLVLQVEPRDGRQTGEVAADGALWASPSVYHRVPRQRRQRVGEHPNVILLTVDTLRADALGAWGARPSVTPALDALARESDVWLEAVSSFNVTNPSFASLMTGLYGKSHGVYDLRDRLPDERRTLAELFAAAGYDTRAVISVRHLAKEEAGLGQGFDEVIGTDGHLSAETAVDRALAWLQNCREPFFLWLHLFDPHTPHTPPRPFAEGLAAQESVGLEPLSLWREFRPQQILPFDQPHLGGHRELYRGEVAYVDRQIDRLMGFLDSQGLSESTVLAFVADHGENLGEHDISYRHAGLFETTTRVPLMIRHPGARQRGRRFEGLVQHFDLFPTLLQMASIEAPPSQALPLGVGGEPRARRRAVFSEAAEDNGLRIRGPRFAYMESRGNPFLADGVYLFDLIRDPQETTNLAGTGLPEEKRLREALHRWRGEDASDAGAAQELSPAEREELRALGYL